MSFPHHIDKLKKCIGHLLAVFRDAYACYRKAMLRTQEQIEAENKRLRTEYGSLFDSVAQILFRYDPIGINFEDNPDEYEPEVRTILPRLRTCLSGEDVATVVHEEFQRWFDSDITGPREKYLGPAEEIWNSWKKRMPNRR